MSIKQTLNLIIVAISGIALVSTLVLLGQRILKPKAGGKPALSMAANDVRANQDINLEFYVNSNGTSFNAYTLVFSFDTEKVT